MVRRQGGALMSLLTSMQAVANKLLTDKGESVTFSRESAGTFDPVTGTTTGSTTSTFSGYCHPSPYALQEIDGTLVQQGDIRLMVESMTSTPQPGDTVTFRSEAYRVMSNRPISVQGGDAAYYCQLRR